MADFNEMNNTQKFPSQKDRNFQVMPEGYVRHRRSERHKVEEQVEGFIPAPPVPQKDTSVPEGGTRVMPRVNTPAESPYQRSPYQRPAATPGAYDVQRNADAPVYGSEKPAATYGTQEPRYVDNRFKATQSQLDQDLYPIDNGRRDNDDYYDDDYYDEMRAFCKQNGIEYIYVGFAEKNEIKPNTAMLSQFEKVYSIGTETVYRVR